MLRSKLGKVIEVNRGAMVIVLLNADMDTSRAWVQMKNQ